MKKKAVSIFWILPVIFVISVIFGGLLDWFPISALISFIPIPLVIIAGIGLKKNYENLELLIPYMSKTLMFSRLSGALFVIGILIDF